MKYAKKFTFFQKYLVMSKKSSTFALVFEINDLIKIE